MQLLRDRLRPGFAVTASIMGEAAKATSLLLSMTKDPKPADWKAWFVVITNEMEQFSQGSTERYFARQAQTEGMDPADLYRLVHNAPTDPTTEPPHDELEAEAAPPVEDVEPNPFAPDEGRPFA